MRVSGGTANSDRNAQTVPFLKKIERKRKNFQQPVQELLKMVIVMTQPDPGQGTSSPGRSPGRTTSWFTCRASSNWSWAWKSPWSVARFQTRRTGG